MLSDATLNRLYEEIGCADGPPPNEGRRRKIKEALEEIWPLICQDVKNEEPVSWMEK